MQCRITGPDNKFSLAQTSENDYSSINGMSNADPAGFKAIIRSNDEHAGHGSLMEYSTFGDRQIPSIASPLHNSDGHNARYD